MNLSISNIAWDQSMDELVYGLMQKHAFDGLEIAPTRIFPQNPYDRLAEAEKWGSNLKSTYGFSIASMQSIWYGKKERLFGSDDERKRLIEYTKKAIDFAAVVGCRNLVFGSPRNRNFIEGESMESAVCFFKEVGDYAAEQNTIIGMEANPEIYGTNYINDTLSALRLVAEVDSAGFLVNLDIGTVVQNRESLKELCGHVKYISHVHISEPSLKCIERRSIHKELKQILETEHYKGYVSIEMSKQDKLSDIEDVMDYVAEVFGQSKAGI